MIPQSFEYHVAKSVNEAARLAAQFGGDGKILAGGHSLVPMMRLRLAAPKHIVDITRIPELAYIREEGGKIQIGALTNHYKIESSELLKVKCPLLPEAAQEIGDVQVRNKGTLGGSLAHSDPAADWPAAILAVDAEIHAVGLNGDRWIAAPDFFVDILTTALEPGELLTGVRVPPLPDHAGDAYVKLRQPASGFAIVGVAARVVLDSQGSVQHASVGITGIGPKAYRATGVELALRGKSPTVRHLQDASAHAADGVDPNSDLYASSEYRAHLARVYTRRALEKAVERAGAK
jgi:aerobic carbon-monoxide dehydrogenase medium subunit